VSDESEELIESIFIQKVGVKYPFVRAKGVNATYRVEGFPTTYVIAPDSTILAEGHGVPDDDFLEDQLADVSLVPSMPADARYDSVRSMWQKQEYKRLAEYLDKTLAQRDLDPEVHTVLEAQRAELQKRSDAQIERIAALAKGPDFWRAQARLERIARAWKGLAPADAAKKEIDRFGKDDAIKKEIAAGKALDKLFATMDPGRIAQRKRLIEELRKFQQRFPGTHAAQQAADEIVLLEN